MSRELRDVVGATDTPNQYPVKFGEDVHLCTIPEHIANAQKMASMARDYEWRLVKFQGGIAPQAGTSFWGECDGPRQGFVWLLSRLYVSPAPILTGSTLTNTAATGSALFLPTNPGTVAVNGVPNAAVTIPFGGSGEIFAALPLQANGLFGAASFSKEAVQLYDGDNLACLITISTALATVAWQFGGQAIEVPKAKLNEFLK